MLHRCSNCANSFTTYCLHHDCHSRAHFKITPSFLAATDQAWVPLQAEKRKRSQFYQSIAAVKLHQSDLTPKIPLEIWHIIAKDLAREYATIAAQTQHLSHDKTENHDIDLSQPVYASYVKVDGKVYVRDLFNADEEDNDCSSAICIFVPASEAAEPTHSDMHIAEDHLGIRKVSFVASTTRDAWCNTQDAVLGVWWRRISLVDTCTTISIQSDVSTTGRCTNTLVTLLQRADILDNLTGSQTTTNRTSIIGFRANAARSSLGNALASATGISPQSTTRGDC